MAARMIQKVNNAKYNIWNLHIVARTTHNECVPAPYVKYEFSTKIMCFIK